MPKPIEITKVEKGDNPYYPSVIADSKIGPIEICFIGNDSASIRPQEKLNQYNGYDRLVTINGVDYGFHANVTKTPVKYPHIPREREWQCMAFDISGHRKDDICKGLSDSARTILAQVVTDAIAAAIKNFERINEAGQLSSDKKLLENFKREIEARREKLEEVEREADALQEKIEEMMIAS